MQIIHAREVPETVRQVKHRVGEFRFKRLLMGQPDTVGNFVLELVTTTHDFFSPRHRHNFDQYRYQLEGEFDFERNGRMKPGTLGYFPEGTAYGPQTSADHSLTLVLQCGGGSRSGYMSADQIEVGTAALKKTGIFEKGVFRRNEDVEGKRAMDGYQAVWEYINKRPMVYPKPRYHDPVMMYPENFTWRNISEGVAMKTMGVFAEAETGAAFVRIKPGQVWTSQGRTICFVIHGHGKIGSAAYEARSAIFCDTGEAAILTAGEPTECLVLRLPSFDNLQDMRVAAE